VKGADLLVDGGSGIALKSGVSRLVVGLTIVAYGTSAPELASSLIAAFTGSGDLCFGNVVGSNVLNIVLILGLATVLNPIDIHRNLIRWELPFMIAISLGTVAIGIAGFLSRWMGAVLVVIFVVYIIRCFKHPSTDIAVENDVVKKGYPILFLLVVLGIAGLGIGASLFVDGARDIARWFGVSDALIGLTVVALGTSLPELFTSAVAAFKGESDISLGNIVGSNIFNILLVLGATGLIHPVVISHDPFMMFTGLPLMMAAAVLLTIFSVAGTRLTRAHGVVFLLLFVLYTYLAVRG
jgi:cation:H+ antiporter